MRVLIAEDDRSSNLLLKSLLFSWGFDVVTAFDGTEAWKMLQEEDVPQIVILDWMMPGMDGLEVCGCIREREKGRDQYSYVIMLTGRSDKEAIITGIDAGADDYIVKPFDKKELRARLQTGQRIIELQTALRVANKKLLIMSRLDPLTGALSRSAMLDDLDLAVYRTRREKKSLSISLLDIDNLKEINERYGCRAGDQILQDSVRRINACIRRTDCLGRFGEVEFLVIMPGTDFDTGMTICHRIQNAIAEKKIVLNGRSFSVTVSHGLAVWDGKASIEEFIAFAEHNLLVTKPHSRNRVGKDDSGQ